MGLPSKSWASCPGGHIYAIGGSNPVVRANTVSSPVVRANTESSPVERANTVMRASPVERANSVCRRVWRPGDGGGLPRVWSQVNKEPSLLPIHYTCCSTGPW